MPGSDVQGPLLIPHLQAHFNSQKDSGLVRSRSQPTGESDQGPSHPRRSLSESALKIPPPMSVTRPEPEADNAAPEQPAPSSPVPPSPVPTEIIPPDLTQEEIVIDIQQSGIKVRDFAYEHTVPVQEHAPELFDPILGWHVYEAMLDNPNPDRNNINPRHLRRLLDLGWVSEEKDGQRWLERDREALEKFDSRPHYPWRAFKVSQPKKEDLREVATTRFQWINAEQLVPQFVNRGMSRFAAAFRGVRRTQAHPPKRPVTGNATENEQDGDTSPRLKKRRLSGAGPVPSGSRTPPHYPLTLVNGMPPQQFPAGRPSPAPPRPRATAPPPIQGTLSRSLQRQLSMGSVASPCSTDLTRSDSRTTLTQGTDSD